MARQKTTGTKNINGLTIDLTKHPGCYAYYLAANREMLEAISKDLTHTVNDYKTIVFNTVLDAYYHAKAKKEFIARIMYAQYKSQIFKYIEASITAACIFEPSTIEEVEAYNEYMKTLASEVA